MTPTQAEIDRYWVKVDKRGSGEGEMTPLERAAKAMYEHVRKEMSPFTCEWEEMSPRTQESYVSSVRAAILSIREPSEAMLAAGAVAEGDGNLEAQALSLWRAMVDALLAEGDGA